jgi:uncharacterized protein
MENIIMPDILSALLLFAAGSIAGFMNVIAGGGSSITLPVLIFMGLDSSVANGTNRIGVLLQNVSAVYAFKREKYFELKTGWKLSAATLPGAVAGAIIASNLSDEIFNKVLGIIMIGIIITMIIPKNKNKYPDAETAHIPTAAYFSMFFIGFYGGFIQVGIGFLLMAALQGILKINLIRVNMHKVLIVLINTMPALLVFIITDNIHWVYGLVLASGNALGGWISAKVQIKKGEGFIKIILIAAILIMAVKLLGIF